MAVIPQALGDEWRRALALHKAGRLAEAATAYRKLLARAPKAARLHTLLAGILQEAWGWTVLNYVSLPLITVALAATLWLRLHQRVRAA